MLARGWFKERATSAIIERLRGAASMGSYVLSAQVHTVQHSSLCPYVHAQRRDVTLVSCHVLAELPINIVTPCSLVRY